MKNLVQSKRQGPYVLQAASFEYNKVSRRRRPIRVIEAWKRWSWLVDIIWRYHIKTRQPVECRAPAYVQSTVQCVSSLRYKINSEEINKLNKRKLTFKTEWIGIDGHACRTKMLLITNRWLTLFGRYSFA